MLHTQHRSRAWHWHRPCPRANATSTLLSGHQVHSWTTHPMQGVKPQFSALLSVTSKVRMGLTSQCLHSLRCRVWGTRRVGAVIPHQGLASHCTWELPGFPSPHPGSSCSLDLHTQLAKPAPRGWVCSSKGWPHPLPPSHRCPQAQSDTGSCPCVCSGAAAPSPAVPRHISRAQQRFLPEHSHQIPWQQRGHAGGLLVLSAPGASNTAAVTEEKLWCCSSHPSRVRGSGMARESGMLLPALGHRVGRGIKPRELQTACRELHRTRRLCLVLNPQIKPGERGDF